jgi:hypothetical protein
MGNMESCGELEYAQPSASADLRLFGRQVLRFLVLAGPLQRQLQVSTSELA